MPALTLESLKALPLKAHAVPVPEFGEGTVAYMAELSADERDARLEIPFLEYKQARGQEHNAGFRAFMVAACWCDQERRFVAANPEAIASVAGQLGAIDSRPVTRMFLIAQEANGIGEEAIEEIEKN